MTGRRPMHEYDKLAADDPTLKDIDGAPDAAPARLPLKTPKAGRA